MVRTEHEILLAKYPSDIFSNDVTTMKQEYKTYLKIYHPDVNKSDKANQICEKVIQLYKQAQDWIYRGVWEESNTITITKPNGSKILAKYQKEYDFELGKMYVLPTKIIYILNEDKEKFYNNFTLTTHVNYADTNMQECYSRSVPDIHTKFKSPIGYVIVLNKTQDYIPLCEVYNHYHGKIPHRHVAWIMSRLFGISCFLQYNNIVHCGINMFNCFISPKYHSVALYGGWWYATSNKCSLIGTTKEIYRVMPILCKQRKKAKFSIDLESIKQIGRMLLGVDNAQTKLDSNKNIIYVDSDLIDIPKPFLDFLKTGSSDDPIQEFKNWDKALDSSYGERKFIVVDIDTEKIYN